MKPMKPHQIDAAGLADGTYGLNVVGGKVTGLTPNTGGGPGTVGRSYLGRSTPGDTFATMTSRRVYLKKITLPTDGLLTNVEAYVDGKGAANDTTRLAAGLWSDNAGSPYLLVGANVLPATSLVFDINAASGTIDGPERWFGLGIGRWCAAGSYWIGVSVLEDASPSIRLSQAATGGGDRYFDITGGTTVQWIGDAPFWTNVTTTNDYAIRANVLTL